MVFSMHGAPGNYVQGSSRRSEIQFIYKALSVTFSKVFERAREHFFQKEFPKENQQSPIPIVSDYFFVKE